MTSSDQASDHTDVLGVDPVVTQRRRSRRWRPLVAGAGALLLLIVLLPPLRARAVAVPATATALDLPFPRRVALAIERRATTAGGVAVDRYGRGPAHDDPVIVLVPGATPQGRDDHRVIRLAEAIARSGRTVLVPELRVYEPTLAPEDLERIAAVVKATPDGGGTAVVGISYGGSLALRAIGDRPDLQDRVALVVVFGAYADLVGVLQGTATGQVQVGDETYPWEPEAEAAAILRRETLRAVPADVAGPAAAALDGDRPLDGLARETRAVVELLTHDDPDRTRAIVDALPPALQRRLRAMSPAHVADRLQLPVRILHARDDPAVPYAEGRRLVALLPDAGLITVESFDHVDLDVGSPGAVLTAVRDLTGVWRVVGALLSAQEPWPPARVR